MITRRLLIDIIKVQLIAGFGIQFILFICRSLFDWWGFFWYGCIAVFIAMFFNTMLFSSLWFTLSFAILVMVEWQPFHRFLSKPTPAPTITSTAIYDNKEPTSSDGSVSSSGKQGPKSETGSIRRRGASSKKVEQTDTKVNTSSLPSNNTNASIDNVTATTTTPNNGFVERSVVTTLTHAFSVGIPVVIVTFSLKYLFSLVLGLEEDAHVFTLLQAKLPPYPITDFDTYMYLCGAAYNMLPKWAIDDIINSSMLPRAILITILSIIAIIIYCMRGGRSRAGVVAASRVNRHAAQWDDMGRYGAQLMFIIIQGLLVSLLGIAIMRLMMFGTITLCILSSLVVSPSFYYWIWLCIVGEVPLITDKPIIGVHGVIRPQPPSVPPPASAVAASSSPVRRTNPPLNLKRIVFIVLVPLVAIILYHNALPQLEAQYTRARNTNAGASPGLINLAKWIKTSTPRGSVFAASPIVSVYSSLTWLSYLLLAL
jgi:hypothetical protein